MITTTPSVEATTRWVEIHNDVSLGLKVLEAIVLELELAQFEPRQIRRIELAYTEALLNAVRHGNEDDPGKMVLIEYGLSWNRFSLSIEDEGCGFNSSELDDPTEEENILRPGGRGLLLIRSLVSDVRFNSQGNRITLTMEKRASSAA